MKLKQKKIKKKIKKESINRMMIKLDKKIK